jgi:hypothetical protein
MPSANLAPGLGLPEDARRSFRASIAAIECMRKDGQAGALEERLRGIP